MENKRLLRILHVQAGFFCSIAALVSVIYTLRLFYSAILTLLGVTEPSAHAYIRDDAEAFFVTWVAPLGWAGVAAIFYLGARNQLKGRFKGSIMEIGLYSAPWLFAFGAAYGWWLTR